MNYKVRFQEMQIIQYEDWSTDAEELTEASAVDPEPVTVKSE